MSEEDNTSEDDKINVEIVNMDDLLGKKFLLVGGVVAIVYLLVVLMLPVTPSSKLFYFILLPLGVGCFIYARVKYFSTTKVKMVALGGILSLIAVVVFATLEIKGERPHLASESPVMVQPDMDTKAEANPQVKKEIEQTHKLTALKSQCSSPLVAVESKGFTENDKAKYDALTIGETGFDEAKQQLGEEFELVSENGQARSYRWDLQGVSLYMTFKSDALQYLTSKPRYIGCDYILNLKG